MTIAWYDPTNHHVSTDKHDPLFTPLGQLWPLGRIYEAVEDDLNNVRYKAKYRYETKQPLTLEEARELNLERDMCWEDIRKIERHHGIGEKE